MAYVDNHVASLSHSFGRIRQPVADPVTVTCIHIAGIRNAVLEDAEEKDGFIKDKDGNALRLDPVIYKDSIDNLTRMFDAIPFSSKLFNQGGALSRLAASKLKVNAAVREIRDAWPDMIPEEKKHALTQISTLMVDILNGSEPWLCLNYPTLRMKQYPPAEPPIGMQMEEYQVYNIRDDEPTDVVLLFTIPINQDCHSLQSFDDSVAMLWHEHMHMYMSGMREGLNRGFLKQNHPLFKDIQNSKTITDYKIVGNFYLAESIYYAEPEEKFCYAAQTVFHNTFNQSPQQMPEARYG